MHRNGTPFTKQYEKVFLLLWNKANLYVAVELEVLFGSLCHLCLVDAVDAGFFAICLFGSDVTLYKVNYKVSPVSVFLDFGFVFTFLLFDNLCNFIVADVTLLD